MDQFITMMKAVMATRPKGSASEFGFVVEAVFVDKIKPTEGFYASLGVYKTAVEADEAAKEYTLAFNHDFLLFRARPMNVLRPMFEPSDVIELTGDAKIDAKLLGHEKLRHEAEAKHKAMEAEMQKQIDAEDVKGTAANAARLIHLCSQAEGFAHSHAKQAEKFQATLKRRIAELKESFAANPKVKGEWLPHIEPLLTARGESQVLVRLKSWALTNGFLDSNASDSKGGAGSAGPLPLPGE